MQGSIEQALSLVVCGNALLQGRDIRPFWPEAEAFIFSRSVQFAADEGVIAADPDQWLRQLAPENARLRLGVVRRDRPNMPDRMTTGFANGGSAWLIEVVRPDGSPIAWEPVWEVVRDPLRTPREERRIWSVTYRRVQARPAPSNEVAPEALAAELGALLEALTALVERAAPEEAMLGWAANFRRARGALDDGQASSADFGLRPERFLSDASCRLLDACRAAWVFGGMGSWNDGAYWGSVEGEADRLSEQLFDLVQRAIVQIANSSGDGPAP